MELAQWLFPSMAEGFAVHIVDYVTFRHCSSIRGAQNLTFGHIVAFRAIIHEI